MMKLEIVRKAGSLVSCRISLTALSEAGSISAGAQATQGAYQESLPFLVSDSDR